MKEQELTSRSAELVNMLQSFDDHTNYHHHSYILGVARDFASIVREYNQLVSSLRALIDKDPSKLPALIVEKAPEYEN